MPAALTHFVVMEFAARGSMRDYPFLGAGLTGWRTFVEFERTGRALLRRYCYVGALGPDLTAPIQSWIFDTLHWRDANLFVLECLNSISYQDPKNQDRFKAYAFGFLSHMAADLILHPYINQFAGYYDGQLVTKLHPFAEANIDSYVARQYCAYKRLSQPNDPFTFSPRSSYGGAITIGPLDAMAFCHWWCGRAESVLAPPSGCSAPSPAALLASLGAFAEVVLGTVYDKGLKIRSKGACGDYVDENLVQHKYQEFTVDCYLAWAVNLTRHFWNAAAKYLAAPLGADRDRAFLRTVPNFNLDTGYALVPRATRTKLVIRYEHVWALYDKLRPNGGPTGYVKGPAAK